MRSDEMGSTGVAGRAGTAMVLATMTGVAIFAVAVLTLLARAGTAPVAADAADDATSNATVPTRLVGDHRPANVPAAVRDAVDLPVVGVKELAEPPAGAPIEECGNTWGPGVGGDPTIDKVLALPDALVVQIRTEGLEPVVPGGDRDVTVSCRMVPLDGGGWELDHNATTSVDAAESLSSTCCDDGFGTATGTTNVPNQAAWGLLDRGSYFLAYPVGGQRWMAFSWLYPQQGEMDQPPAARVIWVDRRGQELATGILGGSL